MADAGSLNASNPTGLRTNAEAIAAPLPPLLAEAQRLAASVILGAHGRRRPGTGETFWQYRRATPGDPLPSVDWRRSARSDLLFVRETEWEAAQTIWLWADAAASMAYRSRSAMPRKGDRAAVLIAALAVLLSRGGERIAALGGDAARPSFGETHLRRVVASLSDNVAKMAAASDDFGAPPRFQASHGGGLAVFVGDFLGPWDSIAEAIETTAGQGVAGLLLQVVDPAEEAFPFDGRIVFESMGGGLRYETDRAGALRRDYEKALVERRDILREIASKRGWRFSVHRTDQPPAPALLWMAQALSIGFRSV